MCVSVPKVCATALQQLITSRGLGRSGRPGLGGSRTAAGVDGWLDSWMTGKQLVE